MEDETYFKQLIAAAKAWEQNDPVGPIRCWTAARPALRGWEWHHLRRRFHSELQTLQGHSGFLCGVSLSARTAPRFACAAEPKGFLLWETRLRPGHAADPRPRRHGLRPGLQRAGDAHGQRRGERPGADLGPDHRRGSGRPPRPRGLGRRGGVLRRRVDARVGGQDGTVRIWNLKADAGPSDQDGPSGSSGATPVRSSASPSAPMAVAGLGRRGRDVRIWDRAGASAGRPGLPRPSPGGPLRGVPSPRVDCWPRRCGPASQGLGRDHRGRTIQLRRVRQSRRRDRLQPGRPRGSPRPAWTARCGSGTPTAGSLVGSSPAMPLRRSA